MGNCCSDCQESIFGRFRSQYEVITEPSANQRIAVETKEVRNYDGVVPPYQNTLSTSSAISMYTKAVHTGEHQDNTHAPISTYPSYQQPKAGFFIKYELRGEIGVGSTSKCYTCTRKSDGKEFACKVIDKRQIETQYSGMLDQCAVEIKVLKTLHHPNIIVLEDNYETPDRIFMVMEKMQGGELFDYVVEKGVLSEEEGSLLVRKITSAVAHMHSLNIIHRDLKPENLLLTSRGPDAEVKLIDFGLAKIMDDDVAKSFLGTRGYLAPEMLQRHAYDKAVDIWALGIIVFVLLCGCLPFDDDSSRIVSETEARKKFTLRFPRWVSNLSVSAKDLLHNLLDVNPKTRFTAEQALNHPWVSGRTVQMNNYLQSPAQLGERIREIRSPHIQSRGAVAMGTSTAASMMSNGNSYGIASSYNSKGASMRPTLDPIKEETDGSNKSRNGNGTNTTANTIPIRPVKKDTNSSENSDSQRIRKNSI